MAIIVRKEWFGGLIGSTKEYKLNKINDFTFRSIKQAVETNTFTHELSQYLLTKGYNQTNEEIRIVDNLSEYHVSNKILTAPVLMWMETTNKCSLNCSHCFNKKNNFDDLEFEHSVQLLEQMHRLGVYKITVTGGEPYLYPNIKGLIKRANQLNIGVRIFTSGCIPAIKIEALKMTTVDVVYISIDGDRKNNDYIRGRDSYSSAFNTIDLINTTYENKPSIVVSTTLFEENLQNIEELFVDAEIAGVKSILFRPLLKYPWQQAELGQTPFKKDSILEVLDRILDLSRRYGIEAQFSKLPYLPYMKTVFQCESPDDTFYSSLIDTKRLNCIGGELVSGIKADGTLIPCGFASFNYSFDNGTYSTSISELWRDSHNINLMRHSNANEDCVSCGIKHMCGGGCHASRTPSANIDEYCLGKGDDSNCSGHLPNEHFIQDESRLYISDQHITTKCGACGGHVA
ncbi:radical SAM/SPASM domain-containing protein [Salidesulfovibrio brasiliensis]|uniref:radical SAM/SPASM domain-containing protein n=1 Tax=Salidesulfovibrio brasiliensis TaxID=221711 RepID=UPI0009F98980|nr:radical SAM protein [Salidesulfovibrio brasiliensis]